MRRFFRSTFARTAAVILFAPQITGCYATQHTTLDPQVNTAHIVGLVTHDGQRIEFAHDHDGATIAHDTLYAVGTQGQVIVATANIDSVLVKNFSIEKTSITVLSVAAVLAVFYVLFTNSAGTKFN
jgi:hypothetical protein